MLNTDLIDTTHTIYNVSLAEAQWIFENGYWIKWNRVEQYAFITNDQYHEVIQLRKWWKWKLRQKDFKRIRFIDLNSKN